MFSPVMSLSPPDDAAMLRPDAPAEQPPPLALVVDDREANRYVVARTLRAAGYAIVEAADGVEALRLAIERVPAVILLDVNLPDLSGFEVARRLKADPATRIIPILQVSASNVSTVQQAAGLEAGADAYLTHPIDPGVLLATVGALRRVRRAEDEARRSAERLRTTLDSVTVPFVLLDREWRFVHVNEEAARVLRLNRDELLGRIQWGAFPATVGSPFEQEYRRAVATGEPAAFTEFYAPMNAWFEIHARPTVEGGLAINFLDVTARRRAADEMALLQAAVESANDGVIITEAALDLPGPRIEYVNPAFERMTGWTLPEIRGRTPRVLQGPRTNPALLARLRVDLKATGTFAGEGVNYRRDGSFYDVEWHISAVRDAAGTITRWVAIQRDITERVQAEEERERLLAAERLARENAESANRAKDEFLATLSHELRTPLNAILGWTHLMRGDPQDVEVRRDGLAIIERNTRAQVQLIEDLLDVSRITSGKLRLDVRPVDLVGVIRGALDAVHPAADARGVRVESVLDPRAGPVPGDPNRLQQVVWNLLSNAIKFTPRGGKVQARLERVHSHVEITVADTGQGIAAEFLPHVFERFRQADSSSTRTHQGLGLGLAITRHLVELHGGSIHAASAGPGQGATLVVQLPLLVVHAETPAVATAGGGADFARADPTAAPGATIPTTAVADPAPTPPGELTGVRVLAIDDDADARHLLARVLGRQGAEVRLAGSVAEGFATVGRERPDVVLCDIEMPGEDGYSFINRLRALPTDEGGGIPAVALTAYARGEDRTRALLAGFDLHLSKPVAPVELVAVVASFARRRRQR